MTDFQAGDIVRALWRDEVTRCAVLGKVRTPEGLDAYAIVTKAPNGFRVAHYAPDLLELEQGAPLVAGLAVSVVNMETGELDTGVIEDGVIIQPDNMVAVQRDGRRFLESAGMVVARTLL